MNFVEIIARKRDGHKLSDEEIRAFVSSASDGRIGDEQLAAMLMAICIRGADNHETRVLTEAMRDSGERWRLAAGVGDVVDKHSTGGVGDSVSLVFAPLVASCGVPVAMMAGAGLGHTQGTLDKLAAIPGFAPALGRARALELIDACGVCIAAQSDEIAPADRKLYALRDLTATVPSLPLIVASIMSKKLAVGAGRLVLDVKVGSGAFCKTLDTGRELARTLVDVGRAADADVHAMLTDMNEPLGDRLGCASEVRAALAVLEGGGSARLRECTLELAVAALATSGRSAKAARSELETALADGRARSKYDEIVRAHGGDPDPTKLPSAAHRIVLTAPGEGWVQAIDGEELGWIAVSLGAGRRRQGDEIDLAAGVVTHAVIGDRVHVDTPIATLEVGRRPVDVEALGARARAAFTVGDQEVARPRLVLERL